MPETAIFAENIAKKYQIGKRQESYRTLRDIIADTLTSPFRKIVKLARGQPSGVSGLDETIWALKDISLEIRQGDVVGIIGRNGSGKSTLLKIISRITEPTCGHAKIRGRVGSLLEVGTGFHPELTGRENIYLNGAILGMKRAEIERKFDEIVSFAETERFVDTPVKHYSSGMYLRLAFAVAAHLEPEILVVDEVLAVGDIRFQRKCLDKMKDFGQEGRTVLIVSHNMPAITRLCKRAILLDEGNIVKDGPSGEVVSAYLNSGVGNVASREWLDTEDAPGGEIARLLSVKIMNGNGKITDTVDIRSPVAVEMQFRVVKPGHVLFPHFNLDNEEGIAVFTAIDQSPQWHNMPRPAGRYTTTGWIPGNLLTEGMMFIEVSLIAMYPNVHQFTVTDAVGFRVVDSFERDSARGLWNHPMQGVIRPLLKWTTNYAKE